MYIPISMQIMTQNEHGSCVLLDKPDDFEIYAATNHACHVDKLLNPSVDDDFAADVLRRAKAEGDAYWRERFEDGDLQVFALTRRDGADTRSVGIGSIVMPSDNNNARAPLLCSVHVLSDYRRFGLYQLLIDSCVKYIAENTKYNDAHVLAKKDNVASIAALKKKGFYLLKSGEIRNTYMGRIPMMYKPRRDAYQALQI